MRGRRMTAVAAALLLMGAVAACTPDGTAPKSATVTTTANPTQVTVAVYGPAPVTSAYTTLAKHFTQMHPTVAISVRSYATHEQAMRALARTLGTSRAPDIFLAGERDLGALEAKRANTRVDELLSERNIDFGDGYERVGLEAFSDNSALQCMPVDVSPMAVYYNTRLVHLAKLRLPGQKVPNPDDGWRFQDFVTAAQQASRRGTKGVYVAPEVMQIAPFVFSGGGNVVDDTDMPTSLQLSSGASTKAMRQLLELVRNPEVTFSPRQLARKDALTRFKQGKLGMLLGFRDLLPELRKQKGLSLGVMPMPRIGGSATVANVSGLCVTPQAEKSGGVVGDVLAYLVGDKASEALAATGYITPANSDALHSDAFLQPNREPNGSNVFINQMRFVTLLPRSPVWAKVVKATDNRLYQLFYDPVIDPFDARLTTIDDVSKAILAPPSTSPSPSPSPSG